MHVHLPKPLHGWREFAGEVGIIVLGVLIALGFEQVVSSLHERQEVTRLRYALDGELAEDRARWAQMNSQDKCALQRLVALDHWVASAPAGSRIADGYTLLLWNTHSSAWDIAKSSGLAELIPLEERLTYSSLYAALDNWREPISNEDSNIEQLNILLATANQSQNRIQIPSRIVYARRRIDQRRQFYPYLLRRFDQLGIKADVSQLKGIDDNSSTLCKPLQT
jgi:hypothetical protein